MAGLAAPPLTLSNQHIDEMISHAVDCSPAECCGLLAGRRDLTEKIFRISNTSPHPSSFTMDPHELVSTFHLIDQLGIQVVGMYHSHPHSAPIPSETDISQCNYPDIPQVIIGKNKYGWEIRSFMIEDQSIREMELIVTE